MHSITKSKDMNSLKSIFLGGGGGNMAINIAINVIVIIIVQSFYSWTRNKLQEKVSQLFPIQKNVLYNILKVPRNPAKGSPEIDDLNW